MMEFLTAVLLYLIGPEGLEQQLWLGLNAAFSVANLIVVVTVVWKLSSKLTSLEESKQVTSRELHESKQVTSRELHELKEQVLELIKAVASLEATRRNR